MTIRSALRDFAIPTIRFQAVPIVTTTVAGIPSLTVCLSVSSFSLCFCIQRSPTSSSVNLSETIMVPSMAGGSPLIGIALTFLAAPVRRSNAPRDPFQEEGANLGHLLPKKAERRFSRSGLLLVDMRTELIELEQENTQQRAVPPSIHPDNTAEISSHDRFLGQFRDLTRTHNDSPLND
jgi:hypothetical protein